MNEKQKNIIESAIKLFAAKGYASTSIQEIATESGISKGAFYLYFKSKDALLYSIFEYYFNEIKKHIRRFEDDTDITPRQKFSQQLEAMIQDFSQRKEFIIMQTKEEAVPLNNDVKDLLVRMHVDLQNFYKKSLLAIYGKELESHIWDAVLSFEGILQSFTKIIFLDQKVYETEELIHYVLRRMDSIVAGLPGENVIVTDEKRTHLLQQTANFLSLDGSDIEKLLSEMRQRIVTTPNKDDLEISLDVLETELNRENPRIPVIQGMLSNLNQEKSLEPYYRKISAYFRIK